MKVKIFLLVLTIISSILIVTSPVKAITPPASYGGSFGIEAPVQKTSVDDIINIGLKVISYIYIIFFIVAAAFILMAAFTYLTSAGDEEKVKSAKNQIIYAAVAIVVALLAFSLDKIVYNFIS